MRVPLALPRGGGGRAAAVNIDDYVNDRTMLLVKASEQSLAPVEVFGGLFRAPHKESILRRIARCGRDIRAKNHRLVRAFGASVGLGGGGGEKIETLCGFPGTVSCGSTQHPLLCFFFSFFSSLPRLRVFLSLWPA